MRFLGSILCSAIVRSEDVLEKMHKSSRAAGWEAMQGILEGASQIPSGNRSDAQEDMEEYEEMQDLVCDLGLILHSFNSSVSKGHWSQRAQGLLRAIDQVRT